MNRKFHIARRIGGTLLYVVAGVAVLLLLFHVFAGAGRPLPGGYRSMLVLSGSMDPAMPVGSVVLSRSVDPSTIREGDIITFVHGAATESSPFVTHRVLQVVDDPSGLSFVTKGDANAAQDMTPVLGSQIVGRVVLVIPFVGYMSAFVHSPLGLVLLILLPAAVLIVWQTLDLVGVRRRKRVPQKTGIMILLLAMIPIGLAQVGTPSGTNAWFSAEAAIDVGLATGTWGEKPPSPQPSGDLKLTPGDAKAVRPSQVPPGPACFPIASMDQSGNLKLDFGELPPGNTNNSPDVFRIKNEGDTPVELRIEGAEGFEGYVVRIRPGNEGSSVVLQPGEECSFDIKVGVAQGTVAGDRTGVIRISAVDGSCTVEIPALLTVVHEETGPDKEGGPMTGDKALSTPSDGADQTEGPGQDGTTATTVPGDPMGTTDQSVGLDGAAGQATQESQTTAPVTDVPPATSDPPNTSTPPVTDDPLGPG